MAIGRERPKWITIGVVTAPQGVRGAVRVRPLTDFPERFHGLERVFLWQGPSRLEYRVKRVAEHPRGLLILAFEGVDDRELAEELRGAEVQLPREEAVPLSEGEYYVFDLIGSAVELAGGERIGELVDVLTTGANDVYVVRGEDGRELLIPAVRQFVTAIDTDAGRIVIEPIPGLLD